MFKNYYYVEIFFYCLHFLNYIFEIFIKYQYDSNTDFIEVSKTFYRFRAMYRTSKLLKIFHFWKFLSHIFLNIWYKVLKMLLHLIHMLST